MLRMWLGNKTPAIVAGWITDPANIVLLAVDGDALLAVGAVKMNGELTLNYVSPDARFRGISRAMLARLEHVASDLGNDLCTLTSTETARRLYQSAGYMDCGPPAGKSEMTSSYPMFKRLSREMPS